MQPWMVTLTDSALADIDDILEATLLVFGSIQLQRYSAQFQLAIKELEAGGPDAALLKDRSDIQSGIFTYPLSRAGKGSPHHFYLRFRREAEAREVIIFRVLHERMDPAIHL